MRRLLSTALACAAALGLTGAPRPARAEPDPAKDPALAVTPPRLLGEAKLDYPRGGRGDAKVTLGVTVNADGTVRDVRVLEGEEPFAGVARDAARGFRFAPARRGEVAVAATIRFEATFVEPKTEPAPKVLGAPDGAASPPPANAAAAGAPDAPLTAEVRGKIVHAPGVSSLARAEVRQLPGAFGDPFRSIEVLPGVTPIISGLPYYYIRGAPPGNVGYLLDGLKVPYLFHFAAGPSVIHPGMVDRVDLYPGAYPAQFGRYSGGVVSAETVGPHAKPFGEGNVRLFDLGALVEVPLGDKWHALAGGRFSYTAAVLSLVAPDVSIAYRDYQARVTYDLSPKETLSLFSFGAYDLAGGVEDGVEQVFFASEFYRADLRYDRVLDGGGKLRAATAFGLDRTRIEGARFATSLMLQPRVVAELPVAKNVRARVGADALVERYVGDPPNPFAGDEEDDRFYRTFFAPRIDANVGVHGDVVLDLVPGVQVVPGLRADLYQSKGTRALGVDPRVASRASISKHVRLLTGHGIAHQGPAFPIPVPAIGVAGLRGGLQRAFQSSLGVEADTPLASTTTVSVFRNHFLGVGDAIGTNVDVGEDDADALLGRANGYAFGAELMIKRRLTERIGGLVSYTLSRSVRQTLLGEQVALFDRTHVANAVLTVDLGRKWRFGTRALFYTGRVNTAREQPGFSETEDETASRASAPSRTPPFFRLDLRLEKRWDYRWGWLAFVAEFMNATLSREALEVRCSRPGQCEPQRFGPVTIPSLGLEGAL